MSLSVSGMKQHPKGFHGTVLELDLRMILAGLAQELPQEGGGVPKNKGSFFGSYNKDYRSLGSIFGSPYFGELPRCVWSLQHQKSCPPPTLVTTHCSAKLLKSCAWWHSNRGSSAAN